MTRPTNHTDLFDSRASALADDDAWHEGDPEFTAYDGDQFEREERAAMRRVAGLSTELQDVTEVEYRALRLERVVLAGVWHEGTLEDAENSLRELAALAQTAGSQVLAGVVQRERAAGLPLVVAGDLNLEPGSRAWDALLGADLTDALGDARPMPTWSSEDPQQQIDHVLVSDGVSASGAHAPSSLLSDHLPVVVDLTLP